MPKFAKVDKKRGLGRVSDSRLKRFTYVYDVQDFALFYREDEAIEADDKEGLLFILVDLNDKNRKVAECWLTREYGDVWSIDYTIVASRYSGRGLSVAMYEEILLNFDMILMCGDGQSIGGIGIWKRLMNSSVVNISAGYPKETAPRFKTSFENNKILVNLPLKDSILKANVYDEDFQEFRLFAEVA